MTKHCEAAESRSTPFIKQNIRFRSSPTRYFINRLLCVLLVNKGVKNDHVLVQVSFSITLNAAKQLSALIYNKDVNDRHF